MKKFLSLTAMCALVMGAIGLSSCGDKKGEDGLPTPQNLEANNVTENSAVLSWDAVDGATEYILVFNGETSMLTTNVHLAKNLTADTTYPWSVQAAAGDKKSDVATSEFKTDPEPEPLVNPTNLQATNVTATTATLSWDAVQDATSYEVKVNGGNANTVSSGTSFEATGLTPNANQTWSVRALADRRTSAWVDGAGFKTLEKQISFTVAQGIFENAGFFSDITADHRVVTLDFFESEPASGYTGMYMSLKLVFDGTLDLSNEYIDIPARTYNILTSATTLNTIWSGGSSLTEITGGSAGAPVGLSSGTMTVSGNHTGYTVNFNLTFGTTQITSTFEGTWGLAGQAIDIGTLTLTGGVDYAAEATEEGNDAYSYLGLGEGTTLTGTSFGGTGYISDGVIIAAANSGSTIPNGTYQIINNTNAGSAISGWEGTNAQGQPTRGGCWIIVMQNGGGSGVPLKWGTITSSYSGGKYTINMAAKTYLWDTITAVITDAATSGAVAMNAPAYSPYKLNTAVLTEPKPVFIKTTSFERNVRFATK